VMIFVCALPLYVIKWDTKDVSNKCGGRIFLLVSFLRFFIRIRASIWVYNIVFFAIALHSSIGAVISSENLNMHNHYLPRYNIVSA
jgi:hypothetical protein